MHLLQRSAGSRALSDDSLNQRACPTQAMSCDFSTEVWLKILPHDPCLVNTRTFESSKLPPAAYTRSGGGSLYNANTRNLTSGDGSKRENAIAANSPELSISDAMT